MSTNPTWYDVLGVDRTASPEEIKAAWRTATDKFEPGSGAGQFRMFNDAADVLLDPRRRREYDEELDAERGSARTAGSAPAAAEAPAPTVAEDRAPTTDDEPAPRPRRERAPRSSRERGPRRSRRPSRVQLAVVVVLALLLAGATALAVRSGLAVRDGQATADARDEAPAAAERAAKALLSYNYKTLPADADRASAYLTPSFEKDYLKTFRVLEKQKDGSPGLAVQSKTVVSATVVGSGVVDAEPGKARVLVFVNQLNSKQGQDPQIFQNRVAMTMVQRGNTWLVDGLKSY